MTDYKKLFIQLSNAYYNLALEKVQIGDYSHAAEYLKKSLRFSKYQMNARNLLGLIFYEMGEYGEAFVQWIISTKLQPNEGRNVAFRYISLTDGAKDKLKNEFDSITKYNQALNEAISGHEDLAMQHLFQVVEANPKFVKALLLLATIQLRYGLYNKAGNTLIKILKIDKYNEQAISFFDIVKQHTGRKEVEEAKQQKVFSQRKMSSDDVILPKDIVILTTSQRIRSVVGGFILGALFFIFVIGPVSRNNSQYANNRYSLKFADKVDEQNKQIAALQEQNEAITKELATTANKLKAFEEKDANFTTQYTTLNSILNNFNNGNIAEAAELYVSLDQSQVVDDTLVQLLDTCKSYIEGLGAEKICQVGTEKWNGGDIEGAERCYLLAIQINPNEPEYLYLLGRLYQRNGRTAEGNAIFDKIIGEFPASKYAKRAKDARGY